MCPGFYPFWFWNGDLTEAEIRWQISEMAAQGVRGFYIHSRQGLQRPYLSESFFEMVDAAIDEAEIQELTVHLYDEYPYPSGVAGGEVLAENPAYLATSLVQETFDVSGGPVRRALPPGKVLCCRAYPLVDGRPDWPRGADLRRAVGMLLQEESYNETGLTSYNRKRYFASEPAPTLETVLPDGPHRVFVAVEALVKKHKYWGNFVDALNPEAVRCFIAKTHERYRARYGDRFGRTVVSIFTDEVTPGWSTTLPAKFRAAYGYDLLAALPALQDPGHPDHLRVSVDLFRLRYRLFVEAWEKPIGQWCRQNGLLMAAEKNLLRLDQTRYQDIPGCDCGHAKAGAPRDVLHHAIRGNARALASAAYVAGKQGALCECYHSLSWGATLQDAKLIAESLLWAGIEILVPHAFFYTTHALAKHDAPPTFFFQMPYWPHWGALSRRLDRISQAFAGTHLDARILVVDPASGLPTAEQAHVHDALQQALAEEHLDFLVVDTELLEPSVISDGAVRLRDVDARVVVVPPMRVVEEPLQRWLDTFAAAGGHLVRIEAPFDRARVIDQLRALAPSSIDLRVPAGNGRQLYVATRRAGKQRRWFILNAAASHCTVELPAIPDLGEVPLDDSLSSRLERTESGYRRTFAPFESVLLEEHGPAVVGTARCTVRPSGATSLIRVAITEPVQVDLRHPNLLRLYDWRLDLLDDQGAVQQSAVVPAIPIANQLEKGGFRFAPRLATSFGLPPTWRHPPLRLQYTAEFQNDYRGPVELVMEPGSLIGDWTVQVNDSPAIAAGAFAATAAHVRGSLGVRIDQHLCPGTNRLVVRIQTDRHDGGLRNALYLAGGFGVRLDPLGLIDRPATGRFEQWEENGLPFYAGVVEYNSSFELRVPPRDERAALEFDWPVRFEDACEVALNGGGWRAMLWSPYRVEVPATELRTGRNELRIRVYTTLLRSFEGEWFDPEAHACRPVGQRHRIPPPQWSTALRGFAPVEARKG